MQASGPLLPAEVSWVCAQGARVNWRCEPAADIVLPAPDGNRLCVVQKG